jgi:hypothetical protein
MVETVQESNRSKEIQKVHIYNIIYERSSLNDSINSSSTKSFAPFWTGARTTATWYDFSGFAKTASAKSLPLHNSDEGLDWK